MFNFLNLGFSGYRRVAQNDLTNARMLSRALESSKYFTVSLPTLHSRKVSRTHHLVGDTVRQPNPPRAPRHRGWSREGGRNCRSRRQSAREVRRRSGGALCQGSSCRSIPVSIVYFVSYIGQIY